MKRFLMSLLMLAVMSPAFSQKQFFVYFQTENDQAFFIKLGEKVYSSSSSGFMLLSKIADGSYDLAVGFPQNKYPEHKFTIHLQGKDRGYLIKNFGEKGWGLFDLQTLAVIMGSPVKETVREAVPDKNLSLFTIMLATAANDPSIRERPAILRKNPETAVQQAVVKEEPKKETPKNEEKGRETVVKTTTPVTKPDTVVKAEPAPPKRDTVAVAAVIPTAPGIPRQRLVIEIEAPPIAKTAPVTEVKQDVAPQPVVEYKRSKVTRKSESSTSEGFGLTFIDEMADGKVDTIRILIPAQRSPRTVARETPKEERKFLEISSEDSVKKPAELTQTAGIACTATAGDNDFLKLQKEMMDERKDEQKINEAKKAFQSRCFSSVQLKMLSMLFSGDAGKYRFFDAAYDYVSDPENFPSLVSELKDEYYVNRFNAMLRKT